MAATGKRKAVPLPVKKAVRNTISVAKADKKNKKKKARIDGLLKTGGLEI